MNIRYRMRWRTVSASLIAAILGIGLSANGATIYVASQSSGSVSAFDPSNGAYITTIKSGLNTPTGLALDAGGNLYIAETETGLIYEYNPNLGTTVQFGNTTSGAFGVSHLAPFGMAVDGSGNVFVDGLDSGGTGFLDEFSPAGGEPISNQLLPSGSLGRGMAFDGGGNLFIAASGSDAIYELPSGGSTLSTYTTTGLSGPRYLAILNGTLYVSNTGSGAQTGYIDAYTSPNSPATVQSGLGGPNGEAFTGAGDTLYFAEYFNQDIVSCTEANFANCSVMVPNINNVLSGANGLAYDPNRILVTEGGPVAEDATIFLIGTGLAALAIMRRRRSAVA